VIQATRSTDVLLVRHAEEPADESDPDLSEAGELRAERLAAFVPAMLGKPDVIIAAAANRRSVRAYLTMRPMSRASGVRICSRVRADQSEALAATLDDPFAHETIVICWTHDELPPSRVDKTIRIRGMSRYSILFCISDITAGPNP
jgi:hypothetical protein